MVSNYPRVRIQRKNFHVYIRAINLHCKYSLELPIRKLFPIEAVFDISADKDELFKSLLPNIFDIIEDVDVYKIAKVLSLAFEIPSLEG